MQQNWITRNWSGRDPSASVSLPTRVFYAAMPSCRASITPDMMLAELRSMWLQLPLPARQPQARTLLVIRASKLRKTPTQVTGIGPGAHPLQRHREDPVVPAHLIELGATRTRCSPSYLIRRGFGERRLGRQPLMRCLSFAVSSRSLGAAATSRSMTSCTSGRARHPSTRGFSSYRRINARWSQ